MWRFAAAAAALVVLGIDKKIPSKLLSDMHRSRSESAGSTAGSTAGSSPQEVVTPSKDPLHTEQSSHGWFRRFAHATASAMGSPWAFAIAILVILAWAISG